VLQNPDLLNRSIKENVAYRISVDGNRIVEAYKAASIYNQIVDYDSGYNATVREEGVKLLGSKC